MHKKRIILVSAIILACLVLGGAASYFLFFNKGDIVFSEQEVLPLLTTDYLKETYEKAKKAMEDIKKEPERVQNYFVAGMEWKTLGDLTNNEKFYKKSLELYEKAVEVTDGKNTIALSNAASINILLKNYNAAEKYLQDAITVSPGDIDLYLRILELYKFYMKKDVEAIVQIYNDAMKRVLNPFGLLRDRAAYYYELGKYEEALKDYETLAEKFPDTLAFKERVDELKLRIGK